MKKKLLFLVTFLTLLITFVSADLVDKNHMNYYVYDPEHILSDNSVTYINSINKELKTKTGGEVAVVILDNIEEGDAKEYTTEIFNELALGEKGKDNGVLILMAIKSRDIQIETGYGAEGFVTDAKAARTYRAMAQVIKDKENNGEEGYEAGILEGFNTIIKDYEEEYEISLDADEPAYYDEEFEDDEWSWPAIGMALLIILVIVIISKIKGGSSGGFAGYNDFDDFGGGFGGGSFGGGFGGFGGGSSGGGGAGGKF